MLREGASEPLAPSRIGTSVTIQDIARALNVSHTTVSRALADSPKISAETKLRVRNAVEQLGYVPSASARMMRGGCSSLVGLIIPDVQNNFYATVAKTVADCLTAHSMQLLLSVTDDDSDRRRSPNLGHGARAEPLGIPVRQVQQEAGHESRLGHAQQKAQEADSRQPAH